MIIKYSKKGIIFEFDTDATRVDEHGHIEVVYRINGKEWHRAEDYKNSTVYFWRPEEILKGTKISGVKIEDHAIAEQLDNLKNELIEIRKEEENIIKNYVPQKIRFAQGGDTHEVYVTTDEIKEVVKNFRHKNIYIKPLVVDKIQKRINSREKNEILEKLRDGGVPVSVRDGLYTTDEGWYEIELQKALEILRPYFEKDEKEKKEKEEKVKKAFEEAKRTGKAVVLYEYIDECNDPNEDCSVDIIRILAMPDGTRKEEREHTY